MLDECKAPLAHRGLRPTKELAANRPHGDRLRYMAGCRCTECRGANTAYERQRVQARKAGDWNGFVPAAAARAHMAELSRAGVGRRSVCDVSGVADSILTEIVAGRKTRIRARTERAILGVTVAAAADHALTDARPSWRLIDELLADGYTKAHLARELGCLTPALQLGRRHVTVRKAYEVQRMHERLRSCPAAPTLALLQELSDEGFHRDRVQRELVDMARRLGADKPDLTVRAGRIRQDAAVLVKQLHAALTE